jgi:hypothetical protein
MILEDLLLLRLRRAIRTVLRGSAMEFSVYVGSVNSGSFRR